MRKVGRFLEISIHEAFADLDTLEVNEKVSSRISIHEAFADLDPHPLYFPPNSTISIHEAFADLDLTIIYWCDNHFDFNPRGLRRPRPKEAFRMSDKTKFQSTRPSQTSTDRHLGRPVILDISIHEAFADLDIRRLKS